MRKQQVEIRVLDMCDAVVVGRNVEDDLVELKAVWPEAGRKVARQIAGHANAAGGAPILWVIGADERGRSLRSPHPVEPADWWAQTSKWFAGVSPQLAHTLVVPVRGERVVALVFETDRAPYVVTADGQGGVHREVPWRSANQTRSAHREELLRLLVEKAQVPQAEVLEATLTLTKSDDDDERWAADGTRPSSPFTLHLRMRLFVSATSPCHLPEHRQKLTLYGDETGPIALSGMELIGPRGAAIRTSQSGLAYGDLLNSLVVAGRSGLQVNASGQLGVNATTYPEVAVAESLLREQSLGLTLNLGVDRSPSAMTAQTTLTRKEGGLIQPRQEWAHYETLAVFT